MSPNLSPEGAETPAFRDGLYYLENLDSADQVSHVTFARLKHVALLSGLTLEQAAEAISGQLTKTSKTEIFNILREVPALSTPFAMEDVDPGIPSLEI